MAGDYSGLFQGLQAFNSSLQQLQATRALQQANDATQQIRDSELDDYQKNQQLRNVGQGLAYSLAASGMPASTIATLAGFTPQVDRPVQSPSEIIANPGYYSPEARQAASDVVAKSNQQAMDLEAAKAASAEKVAEIRAQGVAGKALDSMNFQLDKQADSQLKDFTGALDKSDSIRTVQGKLADVSQRFSRVQQALDGYQNGNDIPLPVIHEAGLGVAAALKSGQTNIEDVQGMIPASIALDKAKAIQYLNSQDMVGANQAGLVNLYKNIITREESYTKNQLAEAAIGAANERVKAFDNPKGTDAFKSALAARLTQAGIPTNPSDVIKNSDGKITTKQRETQDGAIDQITDGIQQLKMKTTSQDPTVRSQVAQQASVLRQKYGVDVTLPMDKLKQVIEYKIRTGQLPLGSQ